MTRLCVLGNWENLRKEKKRIEFTFCVVFEQTLKASYFAHFVFAAALSVFLFIFFFFFTLRIWLALELLESYVKRNSPNNIHTFLYFPIFDPVVVFEKFE